MLLEQEAQQAQAVQKVPQGQPAQAEALERKVLQVLLDQQVVLVLLDHKELKVRRVKKAK